MSFPSNQYILLYFNFEQNYQIQSLILHFQSDSLIVSLIGKRNFFQLFLIVFCSNKYTLQRLKNLLLRLFQALIKYTFKVWAQKTVLDCVYKIQFRIYQIVYNQIDYKYLPSRQTIGGSMDTEKLLNNITAAFETSNQNQSQDLLKKIIEIASKKLVTSKNNQDHKSSAYSFLSEIRKQSKDENYETLSNEKTNKIKRKFITKAKLKRTALKKIANQNKSLHQKFIQKLSKQEHKISSHNTRDNSFTFFQQENEEQKLELSEELQNERSIPYEVREKNEKIIFQRKSLNLNKKIKSHKLRIQQKFNKTKKNFQNYLKSKLKESKADQITCPICIETLIDPVSTICGHSFCFRCLDESMLFGSNCPVCRLLIKGFEIIPCSYLRELIKIKCDQFLDPETLATYKMRMELNEQWKKQRFIDPSTLKQGQVLDVRDTQNIWCKAQILKIYMLNEKVSSILVHYLQWARIYDEIIEIKSIRLAPRDHFSLRRDLPRYDLRQQEENLRGAVITGNNQRPSIRPPNNNSNNNAQLRLASFLQLDDFRNGIFQQMIPWNSRRANQVSFLHHYIGPDSDDQSANLHGVQPEDSVELLRRNRRQATGESSYARLDHQDSNLNSFDEDDSSLGSFPFRGYPEINRNRASPILVREWQQNNDSADLQDHHVQSEINESDLEQISDIHSHRVEISYTYSSQSQNRDDSIEQLNEINLIDQDHGNHSLQEQFGSVPSHEGYESIQIPPQSFEPQIQDEEHLYNQHNFGDDEQNANSEEFGEDDCLWE